MTHGYRLHCDPFLFRPSTALCYICLCGFLGVVGGGDRLYCLIKVHGLAWTIETFTNSSCHVWHQYYLVAGIGFGGVAIASLLGLVAYLVYHTTRPAAHVDKVNRG